MSTAAQDVLNRAIALSDANQAFVGMNPGEVLWRLNYAQGQLWARLAQENRSFWVAQASLASSGGASPRTLDISTITPPAGTGPVERILDNGLVLPSGVPLNIVDFQDQSAEVSPRGYALGQKLYEVGTEWGTAGAVTFSVTYIYRPADLLVNTDLTQLVAVPDRFAAYLDLDLGIYFNGKDAGRQQADPQELQRLTGMQKAVFDDILQYVDHLWGPMIRRFTLPVPAKGEKA